MQYREERRLCLSIGSRDELFAKEGGKASFARITELCREVGTDWVELSMFEGKHEFFMDEAPIRRLIADLKGE